MKGLRVPLTSARRHSRAVVAFVRGHVDGGQSLSRVGITHLSVRVPSSERHFHLLSSLLLVPIRQIISSKASLQPTCSSGRCCQNAMVSAQLNHDQPCRVPCLPWQTCQT